MMSRLLQRIGAWRAGALKQGLKAMPSKAGSSMSPATIWIDGQCAHTLTSLAHADSFALLTTTGDVTAALKAIETLAPNPQRPGLHALRVVVGAPFVRYFALPWQPQPKPQDWVSSARLIATQTGVGNEPWRYAVSDGAWGQGRLAAAMPEPLCAGIERLCKTRKLLLRGIEPAYTFALQQRARSIRDGAIAIVELEGSKPDEAIAHIGLRERGGWTSFIALPVAGALDDVLRDAFALCAGQAPERRYVIGPGDARRWNADATQIQWLSAPWDVAT
jgi:hypothetical protein